VIKVDIAGLA